MSPVLHNEIMDPDEIVREELTTFKNMAPRPLTMQELLADEMMVPEALARFVHYEAPVRYAERISWIESIPAFEEIEELADVHDRHVEAFREMRFVKRRPNLDAFTEVVQHIVENELDVQHVIARGIYKLQQRRGDIEWGRDIADPWLDRFLLNRIGTDLLLNQYLAVMEAHNAPKCGTRKWFKGGIIDPECDPSLICRDVADEVTEMCEELTGKSVYVKVCVHAPWEKKKGRIVGFSYVPGFLRFIMTEILKNSCRATADLFTNAQMKSKRVDIIVCADAHNVVIRVADRALGIPFEVGDHIWSYLYSTAKHTDIGDGKATALAGFGVGLPLSRLYARYLGGTLVMHTLPGYGTAVDIVLKRIDGREIVPDDDVPL